MRARKPTPPADIERLRAYLGELGEVVGRYDADAAHPSNWAAKVWGTYRVPGGTASVTTKLWVGVDPQHVPAIIATALENLLTDKEGERFSVPLFESFLVRAKNGPRPELPRASPPAPGTEAARVLASPRDRDSGSERVHRSGTTQGLQILAPPTAPPPAPEDPDAERVASWAAENAEQAERMSAAIRTALARDGSAPKSPLALEAMEQAEFRKRVLAILGPRQTLERRAAS